MPDTNFNHPLVNETAEYLKVSREYVVEKLKEMKSNLHKEWFDLNPSDMASIIKFYQENQLHLFNVVDFNTWSDAQTPRIDFKKYNIKTGFDFGCGCGTTAIFLSQQGIQMDVADINPQNVDFALWRLRKRGFSSNAVPLTSLQPVKKQYDLITAIDVLEHVVNPLETIIHFRQHAKYFYMTAMKPAKISQHLCLWENNRIVDILKAIGWKPIWLGNNEERGFFEAV